MDQLIQQNLRSIDRIVRNQARMWHLPECDLEDVTQETLLRTFKGWKPSRKDPKVHFLSLVHLNARTTVMRLMGYHNGYKRPQQVKAAGEQATDQVGLYQPTDLRRTYASRREGPAYDAFRRGCLHGQASHEAPGGPEGGHRRPPRASAYSDEGAGLRGAERG